MQKIEDKKIAIVCDWIKDWWWAELVLEHFLELFPKADIYTSIFFPRKPEKFKGRNVYVSYIQDIPVLNKRHKMALTFRPSAFERFDLSSYDIVISSTSAESKWVITKPETLQICYCHTPTRYFWSHYHEYINMMEFGILNPIGQRVMPPVVHKLRTWDFIASARPDYFISNSQNTANRIKKYYDRDATVIYPWINVQEYSYNDKKEKFYLYVWRCIPYKKFDLIVDAFNENWKEVYLVTNTDNGLYRELKKKSKKNIKWKLNISNSEKKLLFSKACCFLFPPEEDFWLVPIEAMASWTPVIAYWKGWALETVENYKTWIFFEEQTVESLNYAIWKFENTEFDYKYIRKHAEKFDKEIFKRNILSFIDSKLK